jgi:hypothetical protein
MIKKTVNISLEHHQHLIMKNYLKYHGLFFATWKHLFTVKIYKKRKKIKPKHKTNNKK